MSVLLAVKQATELWLMKCFKMRGGMEESSDDLRQRVGGFSSHVSCCVTVNDFMVAEKDLLWCR